MQRTRSRTQLFRGNAVQCKCNYILKQMTELDTYLLDNLGSFTLSRQPYQFQYVEWVVRQKICMYYALFGQLRVITPCIDYIVLLFN